MLKANVGEITSFN